MSAPIQVPSGFARRGQMWPLSRWVCMSTKHGSTMPAVEIDARPADRPAGVGDRRDRAVRDRDVDLAASCRCRTAAGSVAFVKRQRSPRRNSHLSSPASRRSRATGAAGATR